MFRYVAILLIAFSLATPVAPAFAGSGSLLGAGFGAAVGGLLGSQIGRGGGRGVATGIGVAAGALIGNDIGSSIDNADRRSYAASPAYAYGQPVEPVFYDTYAPNYVAPPAPPPTYIDPRAGTYCREFSQQIIIDGRAQESYGTACLQPDGSWRVIP